MKESSPSKMDSNLADDPIVIRAERIAALMSRHGAEPEEIREAIMASMRALTQHANESKQLYLAQETENPYNTK